MKLTKKMVSLLLALAMVFGLVPTGALAVGTNGSADQIKSEEGKALYFQIGEDGKVSPEDKGVFDAEVKDENVTISESIGATKDENVFQLTLNVTTKDTVQTVSTVPDAAVVLVMDLSSSMNVCITCGAADSDVLHKEEYKDRDLLVRDGYLSNGTYGYHVFEEVAGIGVPPDMCKECRGDKSLHKVMTGHAHVSCLDQAKETAAQFIQDYAKDADGAKRYVEIVTYAGGDFVNNVTGSWIDSAMEKDEVINAISGITETGNDTVTAMGMKLGKELLETVPEGSNQTTITNKSLILLTDGEPSPYGDDFGGTWRNYISTQDKAAYPEQQYLAPIGFAKEIQAGGASVYSICYGPGSPAAKRDQFDWLKYFSNEAYRAEDADELNDAFGRINQDIENKTEVTQVTIPLNAPYIVPADEAALPAGMTYDAETGALTWKLGAVEPDEEGVRKYTVTFPIKLDTYAEGFVEDAFYPTNLSTFLEYSVKTTVGGAGSSDNGKCKVYFLVPQVKGALPMMDYTVNYYLKDRNGNKPNMPTDSATKSDKLGTQVSAEINTYDGYALDTNQQTAIVLGKDPEKNVINLYYHMTPVTVTVEHYFTTTTIDENGNETTDEAPRLVDTVNTWDKVYYKGDSFTAAPKADSVTLTFDKAATEKANRYENVKLTGDATIKLYYNEHIDKRADAKVTVNTYTYTINWALNGEGKYVPTASAPVFYTVNGSITETMKDGQFYTASNRVEELKTAGYALDTEKSDKYEAVQLTSKQDIVLNYYYFNETNKPAETTVLVRHHYTTNTTLVSGESSVTVTIPDKDNEAAARVAGYVGETYTATPDMSYDGGTWTLDTTRPLNKVLTDVEGDNVIDLYYTRTVDGRVKTTVTVNHYYQNWKNVIGEDGQVTQTPDGDPKLETETVKDNVYVGGSYTAAKAEKDGFSYSGGELTIDALAKTGNVIDLYYDKKPALPEESSSTEVVHEYRTYKKYVDENGVVHGDYELVDTEYGDSETLTGSVGEWFDVAAIKSFGGNDDYEVTSPAGNPDAVRVTLNGANDTYTITYARYVDELVKTSVKVIPVYTSYEKRIVDGEEKLVQVGEPLMDESKAWTNTDALYVGQNFTADHTLEQFQREGYLFSHDNTLGENPYQNVKLVADANTIYLHFSNIDAPTDGRGEGAKIQVVHHYKFVDKYVDENGVYQEKTARDETVTDAAFEKYAGQTVTISALVKNDGGSIFTNSNPAADYTVTEADQGKMVTIDLYYYGENDQTQKATLTVVHHYSNLDQNGNELLPESERTLTVEVKRENGLHAGEGYTVSPEYKNIFALENITKGSFNGSDLTGFDVKLVEGENKVELYYSKTTDTRVKTTVTVIHQYVVLDANGNKRTPEGAITDTFDTVELGAWVGKAFRAEPRYTNDANKLEYGFENAAFVRVDADGTATDPTELKLGETEEDKLLQSVTLDENKTVITINYLRKVDTTPDAPNDNYYRVTVEYKDMDGKTLAASYRTADIREGRDYDVSAQAAKEITGYTIDHVEGAVSGKLNGNRTVTVFYAPESTIDEEEPPLTDKPDGDLTDIPEVDVPTTDLPTTDLPDVPSDTDDTIIVDENVPMGNLPQTGFAAKDVNVTATLGALALAVSLAAAGLGIVLGRKKEEEN